MPAARRAPRPTGTLISHPSQSTGPGPVTKTLKFEAESRWPQAGRAPLQAQALRLTRTGVPPRSGLAPSFGVAASDPRPATRSPPAARARATPSRSLPPGSPRGWIAAPARPARPAGSVTPGPAPLRTWPVRVHPARPGSVRLTRPARPGPPGPVRSPGPARKRQACLTAVQMTPVRAPIGAAPCSSSKPAARRLFGAARDPPGSPSFAYFSAYFFGDARDPRNPATMWRHGASRVAVGRRPRVPLDHGPASSRGADAVRRRRHLAGLVAGRAPVAPSESASPRLVTVAGVSS